jgi:hypothetical protein
MAACLHVWLSRTFAEVNGESPTAITGIPISGASFRSNILGSVQILVGSLCSKTRLSTAVGRVSCPKDSKSRSSRAVSGCIVTKRPSYPALR